MSVNVTWHPQTGVLSERSIDLIESRKERVSPSDRIPLSLNQRVWVSRSSGALSQAQSASWCPGPWSSQNPLRPHLQVWVTMKLTKIMWVILVAGKVLFLCSEQIWSTTVPQPWGPSRAEVRKPWPLPQSWPGGLGASFLYTSKWILQEGVKPGEEHSFFHLGLSAPRHLPFCDIEERHIIIDLCPGQQWCFLSLNWCVRNELCVNGRIKISRFNQED